ncbi:MAG: hypothetical protein HONBIEJF_01652 [Fimbriimonadaceae bacterium]|nr:hypothetical protein [Fimbriimonadaceae bacterium]
MILHVSLRTKILLHAALLVVLTAVAILINLELLTRSQVDAAIRQANSRTRTLLLAEVDAELRALAQGAALLADRPGTKNVYLADAVSIADHLREVRSIVGADWLIISDAQGKVLGCSDPGLTAPGQSTADSFGVSFATQGKSWKGIGAIGSHLATAATHPIRIGEYVQATITAGITIDNRLANHIAKAIDAEVVLFAGDRAVATTSANLQLSPALHRVQRVKTRSGVLIGQVSRVPGSQAGLSAIALLPESAITGPFISLRNGIFMVLAGALLATGVLAAWFSAGMTKPISALTRAANILQAGAWPEPFNSRRDDELGLLQGVFDDMTDSLRRSREKLMAILQIDPLTELWNHRTFREKLSLCAKEASENRRPLGLIIIDVDQFEAFNREHSADEGDRALLQIAQILREESGESDILSRYGGNDFALATHRPNPTQLAERLRLRVATETAVTVSVGVASLSESTSRPELLILAASTATQQAKQGGRNRVREFSSFHYSGSEDELQEFLQHGNYAAVRALAEAVDAKDEYTRGHSQRVAEYARQLARAVGHDAGFVELVYMCGTLHDVGKIGVPDSVLKKQAKLTDEEFDFIKKHPEAGERIVAQIPTLRDALPGIRSHHERWDGKGYPDGLEAENIPLLGRILAVADTYDAMTSDRPYRKGLPISVALDEIRKSAGTQLDPELALKFVEIFESEWQAAA